MVDVVHLASQWEAARNVISLVFEEEGPDKSHFRLFVGGDLVAANQSTLESMKISFIVNCAVGFPNQFEHTGVKYHQVPILDVKGADLLSHIPSTLQFIENARSKHASVLVHCMWGISRAPSIIIAYLMHSKRYTLSDALRKLTEVRPAVRPNPSFVRQLLEWESSCFGIENCGSIDLEEYRTAYHLSYAAGEPRT